MINLIPEWRVAWRYLSVQLAAVLAVVSVAYDYLPAIRDYLPEGWAKYIALAIIAARVLDQGLDRAPR